MRVHVDGSNHPIHEDATGVRMTLVLEDGQSCEVQVGQVGDALNVILAGFHGIPDTDARGNTRIYLEPDGVAGQRVPATT